jgi:tetratricopeptide (TPR) repeat protein
MKAFHGGPGCWATALGLALLAGCQQAPKNPTQPIPLFAAEPTPKLSAAQNAEVLFALGRTLENTGEVEQAIRAYNDALRQDPERIDAAVRLAMLLDQQGRFEESQALYKHALTQQPNNADICCNLGYSLYLQRRWKEASQVLRWAIHLEPDHQRAHNNLGLVLASIGDVPGALRAFHGGGCNQVDAYLNLAYVMTLQQKWGEAGRAYQEALALDPSSSAAQKGLQNLQTVLAKLGVNSNPKSVPHGGHVVPVGAIAVTE